MITHGENLSAQTNGVQATAQFNIKATGKAFKILSDGLYSDKPLAVVRELSCNAWDSHVAAGKTDVPFEVCLPTTLNPLFYVKDFGIGLSHDDVMHLFTTFFDSTKSESNDFVGALGLGSKSPFSYVDQFNVTSCWNGMERKYTAYIGEGHLPSISLLSETPTIEGNGMMVSMPVKSGDCGKFVIAAQRVLPHFDTEPVVKGCSDLDLDQGVLLRGKGWVLLDKEVSTNHWSRSEQLSARMGTVAYPITAIGISEPGLEDMVYYPFIIDFPLGSLDVAASREALSYDGPTLAAIKARLTDVRREVGDTLVQGLAAAETLWEAHILYQKTVEASGLKSMLPTSHQAQWTIPMSGAVTSYVAKADDPIATQTMTSYTISLEGIKLAASDLVDTDVRVTHRTPFNNRHLATTRKIKPKDSTRIYCVDENTGWSGKIVYHESTRPTPGPSHQSRYISDSEKPQVIVITGDYANILKQLGDPPYTLTSTLDNDPSIITQTVGSGGNKVKVKLSKVWQASPGSGTFTEPKDKPDLDSNRLVACMWRGSPTRDGTQAGVMDKHHFSQMTMLAKESGLIPDETIMGIPASHRNLVKKTAWVDVFDHIEDKLEGEIKKQRKRIWRWRLLQSKVMSSNLLIHLLPEIIKRGVDLTEVNRLNAVRKATDTLDEPERKRLAALVRLCGVLDKDEWLGFDSQYEVREGFPLLARKSARLLDMFPLLKWAGYKERNPDMVEYVVAIDAAHHNHAAELIQQRNKELTQS